MGMTREIVAVDQDNVRISVIVIVDEGASGSHCFWQPFFAEGSIVVGEVDAGLSSDVTEMNLGLGRENQRT